MKEQITEYPLCTEPDCGEPRHSTLWCDRHFLAWKQDQMDRRYCKGGLGGRYSGKPGVDPRLKKYNLSPERYAEMAEACGNKCEICGNPQTAHRVLVIDHDHRCCNRQGSCGKCVRGLLCNRCNYQLGQVDGDQNWYRAAVAYLQKFNPPKDSTGAV